jgi:acyl-CoA synthetase (AMP-forming)/AMP-acid ligase II
VLVDIKAPWTGSPRDKSFVISKDTIAWNINTVTTTMPTRSSYPALDIPEKNLLSYIFPANCSAASSDEPIWIEASDPSVYLTPRILLSRAKRLAVGIENLRGAKGELLVKPGEVVLILSPNQIQIPVAYLGIIGSARIFSGINPTFSARGTYVFIGRINRKAVPSFIRFYF